MNDLKQEFETYNKNKAQLLEAYRGKFIVLKDGVVLGSYDDRLTAIRETSETLRVGTFLVQHVTDLNEVRYHSRYALPH